MNEEFLCKAKRIDTGTWIEGVPYGKYLICGLTIISHNDKGSISQYSKFDYVEIIPETICHFTNKYDIHGNKLFQGDRIKSTLNGIEMTINYGEYEMYCPVDKTYMNTVGFYVEAENYPYMPLGPTENYAELVGNIHNQNINSLNESQDEQEFEM